MPVRAYLLTDERLMIVHAAGELTAADFVDEMNAVSGRPGFDIGMDRLAYIDPTSEYHGLDIDALRDIRNTVRRVESPAPGGPVKFRNALICPEAMLGILVDLYRALWEEICDAEVEIRQFTTTESALSWLDRPHLDIGNLLSRQ